MDLGIRGKVALVTGANRGLGLASALEMAKEGCDLVITGRNETDLAEAKKQVKDFGVRVVAVAADLEEAEGVQKVISSAFDEFGHVDILFNNAGHAHACTPISATDEDWASIINVHLMACVRICRAVIPKMVEQGWGRIINMSSIAGIMPITGLSDYSAAKAAIISYTRSIAMEYSQKGICANAICPGFTFTEILEKFSGDIADEIGKTRQEVIDNIANQATTIKRCGRAEEIGKVVAFLASESASFVTGCTIQVDGGALAGLELKF
uniref:3-oxoacyl-[acyl-carrier protein] reductase n=1 Tax=Candidatus Kentrum sp. FW TaxID=2126338 RepID=A0A450T6W3_9GAMM|nr:MAG: 3-oxoacyl-[acyl-carrier protein] reductase [Candidatus Kentron sp. FW]